MLVRHLDEPFGDFSIFPTYLVSKMARAHVTVALSGDGGRRDLRRLRDTTRPRGSPGFRRSLRCGRAVGRRSSGRLPPAAQKKGAWNKLRRFAQGFDNPASLRHLRWMMFLSTEDQRKLYSRGLKAQLGGLPISRRTSPSTTLFGRMGDFDRMNGELYLDLKTYLVDDIMVKVDRMSMAPSARGPRAAPRPQARRVRLPPARGPQAPRPRPSGSSRRPWKGSCRTRHIYRKQGRLQHPHQALAGDGPPGHDARLSRREAHPRGRAVRAGDGRRP